MSEKKEALRQVLKAIRTTHKPTEEKAKEAAKRGLEKEVGRPTLEALGYIGGAAKNLMEKRIKLKKRFGNLSIEAEKNPSETKVQAKHIIDF